MEEASTDETALCSNKTLQAIKEWITVQVRSLLSADAGAAPGCGDVGPGRVLLPSIPIGRVPPTSLLHSCGG